MDVGGGGVAKVLAVCAVLEVPVLKSQGTGCGWQQGPLVLQVALPRSSSLCLHPKEARACDPVFNSKVAYF